MESEKKSYGATTDLNSKAHEKDQSRRLSKGRDVPMKSNLGVRGLPGKARKAMGAAN